MNNNFVFTFDINNFDPHKIAETFPSSLFVIAEKTVVGGAEEQLNIWASKETDILDGFKLLISLPESTSDYFFLVIDANISVNDFVRLSESTYFVMHIDLLLSAFAEGDDIAYPLQLNLVQESLRQLIELKEVFSSEADFKPEVKPVAPVEFDIF